MTPAASRDDLSPTHVTPPDPCRLVSLAQARSATAGEVATVTEAPLGPTCIYHTRHAGQSVTMAVSAQSTGIGHLAGVRRLRIAGADAFCGRLGETMLLVRLPRGRTLSITAPCGIAQRFAQIAVPQLRA